MPNNAQKVMPNNSQSDTQGFSLTKGLPVITPFMTDNRMRKWLEIRRLSSKIVLAGHANHGGKTVAAAF